MGTASFSSDRLFPEGASSNRASSGRRSGCRRLGDAAIGGLLGLLLAMAGHATAIAGDDDDSFGQKIINKMIGGALDGQNAGIDYHERSPLVIPPSTAELPPPQSGTPVANVPDWPKDTDRQPKKRVSPDKIVNGSARHHEAQKATATASEADKGKAASTGTATEPGTDPEGKGDGGAQKLPSYFAATGSLFGSTDGLFKSLAFWRKDEDPEQATFTGEPPRDSLIDPPVGYQTPSPNYAYGINVKPANNSAPRSDGAKDPAAAH